MEQSEEFLTYAVAIAAICAILGGFIYSSKGGSFLFGFLVGGLLSVLGVLIVAVMQPQKKPDPQMATRECPHCRSQIRRDASVCPHCQRESPPWRLHEGRWWTRSGTQDYWLDERSGEWKLPGT